MSHTPGPWQSHEKTGSPPYVTREGEPSGWVCQTVTFNGVGEAAANARLIAAAPDMLDALNQCVAFFGELTTPPSHFPATDPAYAAYWASLAAIAKATK